MASRPAFVIPFCGMWVVKVDGNHVTTPTAHQWTAIAQATEWLSERGGGELVVLGEDGQIRQRDTVGQPNPRGQLEK